MVGEGLGLFGFVYVGSVMVVILVMFGFGLFIYMVCGVMYVLVLFIDCCVLGGVVGIIGVGGNVGVVVVGFLFKGMVDM